MSVSDEFIVDDNPRPMIGVPCVVFTRGVSSVDEIMTDWAREAAISKFPLMPRDVAEKAFNIVKEKGVARVRLNW